MIRSGHKHQHQRDLLGGSLLRAAACSIWWFIGSRRKQSDQQPKRKVKAEHVSEPFEPTSHLTRPLNLQYFINQNWVAIVFYPGVMRKFTPRAHVSKTITREKNGQFRVM